MSTATHTALIRIAPIHNLARHNDPAWNRPGRNLYEAGSLRFLPGVSEVPLLVDHDNNHRIGTVHELARIEWIDGPWIAARASLSDPPAWLRQYQTKASFGHKNYNRRTYTEGELIAGAFIDEVSVLSPSVQPREPLAQVLLLQRTTPAARQPGSSAVGSDRLAADEVSYGRPVLRRLNVGRVIRVR